MRGVTIKKILVTLVLVSWYVWMPHRGYATGSDDIPGHYLYMLSHASVWHLLGNLLVLWLFKRRLWLMPSLVIAVLASFLPVMGSVWDGFRASGITMGFSGVIFAMAGVGWGVWCPDGWSDIMAFRRLCMKVVPFALIGVLLPHVNWCLHLYCLLAGFVYGRYNKHIG